MANWRIEFKVDSESSSQKPYSRVIWDVPTEEAAIHQLEKSLKEVGDGLREIIRVEEWK